MVFELKFKFYVIFHTLVHMTKYDWDCKREKLLVQPACILANELYLLIKLLGLET
jgi:hypothetical protein